MDEDRMKCMSAKQLKKLNALIPTYCAVQTTLNAIRPNPICTILTRNKKMKTGTPVVVTQDGFVRPIRRNEKGYITIGWFTGYRSHV